MHVQPYIVMAMLEIRDRDLRDRAARAARHAAAAEHTSAPRATEARRTAHAIARTAPAGC